MDTMDEGDPGKTNVPETKRDIKDDKTYLASPIHEKVLSTDEEKNDTELVQANIPTKEYDTGGDNSCDSSYISPMKVQDSNDSRDIFKEKNSAQLPSEDTCKTKEFSRKEKQTEKKISLDLQSGVERCGNEGGNKYKKSNVCFKTQGTQTSIQLRESSLFRDFSLDVATMQVEVGLMSVNSLEDLDPEIDDWPLLLVSQLRLRDNMIKTLSDMLTGVLEKGRRLEEDVDYLKLKMLDLKQQVKRNRKNKKAFCSQTTDEDFADAWRKWYSGTYQYYSQENASEACTDPWEYVHEPSISHSEQLHTHSESNGALQFKDKIDFDKHPVDDERLKKKWKECESGKNSEENVEENNIDHDNVGNDSEESNRKSNTHDEELNNTQVEDKKGPISHEKDIEQNQESGEDKTKQKAPSTNCKDETGHGWDNSGEMSITDQVKAVATEAVHGSGYVFQEELGLYYDYNTQYYYNAESGLYYDPKTGTYFYYDHATQAYQFHSQVAMEEATAEKGKRKDDVDKYEGGRMQTKRIRKSRETIEEDKEDGECTDSEEENKSEEEEVQDKEKAAEEEEEWEAKVHVPPSLRLMVIESSSERVKVGTLHLVTLDGGTVGREAKNLVQLPDLNISKVHAEISYYSGGTDDHHYYLKDLGSNNGTFVNDTRLSEPRETSQEVEIGHGFTLQFGPIKVKCHIHPGLLTCNECEPGLVNASNSADSRVSVGHYKNAKSREKARKKELQAMKKKYALTSSAGVHQLGAEYNDRADQRRKEVGSDNPYEKTEVASTEVALRDNNKGFTLLQKMGWSEGQSLGRTQIGIKQPIQPPSVVGRSGFGSALVNIEPSAAERKRKKVLQITKERFNQT